jgi:hypothetical protein
VRRASSSVRRRSSGAVQQRAVRMSCTATYRLSKEPRKIIRTDRLRR